MSSVGRSSSKSAAFGTLAALASISFLSCSASSAPRSVVLVSIDTLRADHLGCYGYKQARTPNIDRLAAEGALFENAATAVPLTLPAHSSIFTGRTPLQHGVVDNFGVQLSETEETLAEALKAKGFATAGFVGAFVLDSRWGIAQGFDTYFDRFDAGSGQAASADANQRPGDQVLAPALEWIRAQGEKPFFAFIHFFDPHAPYAPPELYRAEHAGKGSAALYDGEIAFVDSLIGQLRFALEEQGIDDETLLVLLGDHGESLGDHGETFHGYFIYDSTIHVPLLMRGPAVRGGTRIASQVRTIDVMPTILDLVGDAPPAAVEGVSLRPLLERPGTDPELLAYVEARYAQIHFGWAPLRGVRSKAYKFIDAPERELYDLRADPGESRNLYLEKTGVATQLASAVTRLVEAQSAPRANAAAPPDPETEQRLRALGYVTSRVRSAMSVPAQDLPDPKKKIGLFKRVAEARGALEAGDTDRAVVELASVLEQDPDLTMAYTLLGSVRLGQRSFVEAERVFRSALARDDENVDAIYGLALAYKGQGRLQDAAAGFERCLSLDPHHEGSDYMIWFQGMRASYQLAEVRLAQGRAAETEQLLRETLRARADNSVRLLLADSLLAQAKVQDALSVLRDAERQDPESPLVHLGLGNVLVESGDLESALASYRRSESLAPGDARVFNGMGNVQARRGALDAALDAYQKAVLLNPSYAPAQNNLGITLGRLGRPAEAEKAFLKAIEADPAYPQAYNNLGTLYLKTGALRKAVPFFRRALALRPDYAQAQANLARALARTGS